MEGRSHVGSEAGSAAEDGRIAGRKKQLHSSRPGLSATTARIFPPLPRGNFGHLDILDISKETKWGRVRLGEELMTGVERCPVGDIWSRSGLVIL